MNPARLQLVQLQLTWLCEEDEEFRDMWDTAVRTAADAAVAEVTHQRTVRGQSHGAICFNWEVPVPVGWDRAEVGEVFGREAITEARRRLASMQAKGML